MVRARRVPPLGDPPALRQLAEHHAVVEEAIYLYYSPENPDFHQLFASNTPDEIRASCDMRLQEARAASALTLLAAIEASFRVDYLRRNYLGKEDSLSHAFRKLYKRKGDRVTFSHDILEAWLANSDVEPALVDDIRTAFKYRNWLAHGRCWVLPKSGRQYDFKAIYDLGCRIEAAFPFLCS